MEEKHIESKMTRAEALRKSLADLNSYVNVEVLNEKSLENLLSEKLLENYDLVICTEFYPLPFIKSLNKKLREMNKGFICSVPQSQIPRSQSDFCCTPLCTAVTY